MDALLIKPSSPINKYHCYRYVELRRKYEDLAGEIKKLWKIKMNLVPVVHVVSALGLDIKSLKYTSREHMNPKQSDKVAKASYPWDSHYSTTALCTKQ